MKKLLPPLTNSMLEELADCLCSGGTVLFPTETVYGLGANALNDSMVTKVSTNSTKDAVSVYLYCRTLIPKRRIRKLEEQIKKHVIPNFPFL